MNHASFHVILIIIAYVFLNVTTKVNKLVYSKCIAVRKVATPLQGLTCHMGSHSVTCHPAEVTFPP